MASIPPSTDPVFLAKKQSVIDVIKARRCREAHYINSNFNNYSDLIGMLFEFSKTFDCDASYLDSLLAPFSDADLIANGIYYNKIGGVITNPNFVIKCTGISIVIDQGGAYRELDVTYDSTVSSISVSNNTLVGILNIGGRAKVDLLAVGAGSCINILLVKSCGTYISELTKITENSCVNHTGVDEDAVFGGYECVINATEPS